MGISEVRRAKQLEDENGRLKSLIVDLTRDKHVLQEVLRNNPRRCENMSSGSSAPSASASSGPAAKSA